MPEKPSQAVDTRVRTGPSPIHGTGCFAALAMAPGSFIATFTGQATTQDGTHVLWASQDGETWEGRLGTSVLRFLNHSHAPNAAFDGFDLYATAAIAVGEEITIDYQP